MILDKAQVGDTVTIEAIPDAQTAVMAMRLGIAQGQCISVCSKIPGGPLVIRRGQTEIALGREICKQISVQPTSQD